MSYHGIHNVTTFRITHINESGDLTGSVYGRLNDDKFPLVTNDHVSIEMIEIVKSFIEWTNEDWPGRKTLVPLMKYVFIGDEETTRGNWIEESEVKPLIDSINTIRRSGFAVPGELATIEVDLINYRKDRDGE